MATGPTEYFNCNFKTSQLSAFSSLKSPTFCTKSPISRVRENFHFNLYIRKIVFFHFSVYYKRNRKTWRVILLSYLYCFIFTREFIYTVSYCHNIFLYSIYFIFLFRKHFWSSTSCNWVVSSECHRRMPCDTLCSDSCSWEIQSKVGFRLITSHKKWKLP